LVSKFGDIVERRYNYAKEYLFELDQALKVNWLHLYESYISGDLTFIQSLTLVNPIQYERISFFTEQRIWNEQIKIQGQRTFEVEPAKHVIVCQSHVFWGYFCPLNDRIITADHIFPYSFGGPTDGRNKIHLCEFHNKTKSNDLHNCPWEQWIDNPPQWLASQIDRLNRLFQAHGVIH